MSPLTFVNLQVHRRRLKFTTLVTNTESNTKKLSEVRPECDLPLYCDWEVASLFLAKYADFKVGWGNVQSLYHVTTGSPQAFFLREDLSLYRRLSQRVSGVPVFIHESDLSMGLPIKSPINLRLRCIRHLSRLLVRKSRVCGETDQGFRSKTP